MKKLIEFLHRDEEGQGMVEYALVLAVIAIAAIVVLKAIGSDLSDIFDNVAGYLGI